MFDNKERIKALRSIDRFECSWREYEGVAFKSDGSILTVPSSQEVLDSVLEEILPMVFSVKQVENVYEADIVVRIFKKLHAQYKRGEIWNFYGANCYVRENENSSWYTIEYSGSLRKLTKECIVRLWSFDDECIDFKCDFEDLFLKMF